MAWTVEASFRKEYTIDDFEFDELYHDADFVLDPAEIFDELPQPFRLIDKTVEYVFDRAWEAILELEFRAIELGGKLPIFEVSEEVPHLLQASLMCSSSDGKYLFVAAKSGVLFAVDSETTVIVAKNDEVQSMTIKNISTANLIDSKYLICLHMTNG